MVSSFVRPDWQDLTQVEVFCSTRADGCSVAPFEHFNLALHVGDDDQTVQANRDQLRKGLPGVPELQWLDQVHGTDVIRLHELLPPPQADSLVTSIPGFACCVMTADCLPVILVSEDEDEVAALHAGWRGLAAGVIENTLRSMATSPEKLRAWLGPAIGPCHFEVGSEVREAFLASMSAAAVDAAFSPANSQNKFMADLRLLARTKLVDAGVARVDACEICSYCDGDRFYSYRRDQQTGRNVTGVYLRK